MKANKFLIVICFLFTVAGIKSEAQIKKTVPLSDFLIVLQEKFNVVFTYADENVEDVLVSFTHYDFNLYQFLVELEQQTNLIFRKLDSRYIAIQKKAVKSGISGFIIDRKSKEYLEGVYIYTQKNYTLSDENGFFTINVNWDQDSLLAIRHIGYAPLFLDENEWQNENTVFELEPEIQFIDEVVVNYIAKGIDKMSDGSVQVNIQNLEVLPGLSEPDVLHTLQILPGITSINETVADINIRGGTNDQSLVLWDGIKMYQTGHFFGLISAFNSHLIHKIRIIKNGANVYYDEGVSGIIDMQQQDYLVNKLEVNSGLNMLSGDFVAKIPLSKKISLIMSARHSINNLIKTPTYENYYRRAFENTKILLNQQGNKGSLENYHDFSFYDFSGKFLYDITEKDKLQLSVLHVNNLIKYKEIVTIPDSINGKVSQLKQSTLLSNLKYSHSWNNKHVIESSFYLSYYLLEGWNTTFLNDEQHLQENEVTDWGIKINSKNYLTHSLSFLSGYQFKEIGIRNLDNIRKPEYFRDAKDVLRIHSIYLEAEGKRFGKNLYLRAGLRTNYISKFNKFYLEPVIILNYFINDSFSIMAVAEKKNQHTTQLIDYQTDFLGIEKRRWVLSNETSVPLLISNQFTIGVQYNRNNFLISIEGYQKNVDGIITPSQGFQNQFQLIYSIGQYKTHGVEFLINKRFMKSNVWTNYTLAQSDYSFPDLIPSVFPNNMDIRHNFSFGSMHAINHFEISAGGNYRTGKPYTQAILNTINEDNEIVFEKPNASRLEEYIRFDISAKYKFNFKNAKAEIGFSVWNILNRDNVLNIYYRINEKNEIEMITQNALGITPNVNLRLKF